MIQKNNPFLLNKHTILLVEKALVDYKNTINQIEIIPQTKGLSLLVQNITKIIKNGFIMLEVKREDFNSTFSRKTIENLKIKDIKMPFDNFCIKFINEDSTEEMIFIDNKKDKVIFSREIEDSVLSCHILKNEDIIQETLNIYQKDSVDMILDSISTIMYFSAFNNDKERIQTTKLINKNPLSRKYSKTISVIKLNGKIYSNEKNGVATNYSSDKTWVVKGHWRNQPFGTKENIEYKTIWIDCFWKGTSKKVMDKIYKVN